MNKEKRELCDRCGEEHTLTQGCEYPPSPAIKFGELTQNKEKKEIEERFYKEFAEKHHGVNYYGQEIDVLLLKDNVNPQPIADFWLKELDSYTNKKLSEAREKIEKILVDEINTAHSENQPTSRLTSAYNRILSNK